MPKYFVCEFLPFLDETEVTIHPVPKDWVLRKEIDGRNIYSCKYPYTWPKSYVNRLIRCGEPLPEDLDGWVDWPLRYILPKEYEDLDEANRDCDAACKFDDTDLEGFLVHQLSSKRRRNPPKKFESDSSSDDDIPDPPRCSKNGKSQGNVKNTAKKSKGKMASGEVTLVGSSPIHLFPLESSPAHMSTQDDQLASSSSNVVVVSALPNESAILQTVDTGAVCMTVEAVDEFDEAIASNDHDGHAACLAALRVVWNKLKLVDELLVVPHKLDVMSEQISALDVKVQAMSRQRAKAINTEEVCNFRDLVSLPASDIGELDALEEALKNLKFEEYLIKTLENTGSMIEFMNRTHKETSRVLRGQVKAVMEKLITPDLGLQFNMAGHNRGSDHKRAFVKYQRIIQLINEVIRRKLENVGESDCGLCDGDIKGSIAEFLRTSYQRTVEYKENSKKGKNNGTENMIELSD